MSVIKVNKKTVEVQQIDVSTGEDLGGYEYIKHTKIIVDDDETFCTLFGSVISVVDKIDKLGWKILLWCSQNCIINSNKINLGKYTRSVIAKTYSISDGTIRNSICSLCKSGALIREDSSTYTVNPKYFWRGNNGERKKYILELELIADNQSSSSKKKQKIKENNNFDNEGQ